MTKIATWLSTKPDDGVIFQYTLSVMDAFSFAKKHMYSNYDIVENFRKWEEKKNTNTEKNIIEESVFIKSYCC